MTEAAKAMEALPDDVRWRIEKCDGYIDLNMLERARGELREVAGSFHDSIPFRRCELRLALEEKKWPLAADLARALRQRAPSEAEFWIQLAYAVRRVAGVEAARVILLDARIHFPRVSIIPFNLACYACQIGRFDEARDLLRAATQLDEQCSALALEDEDLKPLWSELGD